MKKKKKKEKKKKSNILITTFKSCHNQQQILSIIKTYKALYIRPLFVFLSCKRRGGYLKAPFLTVSITAILRSFKAIADFQQTNKLLRNK
jgi:hypothetical protein